MSDMRERLARAAANALYEACGTSMEIRFPEDCSLDDVEQGRHDGLMAAVDAILAELETPTPEMVEAAFKAEADFWSGSVDEPPSRESIAAAFTAAIRAARGKV